MSSSTHFIREQIKDLPPRELYLVMTFCMERMREQGMVMDALKTASTPPDASRRKKLPAIWYRKKMVKCGKSACRKCAAGTGHGPYWFRIEQRGGKRRETYWGKTLGDTNAKGRP